MINDIGTVFTAELVRRVKSRAFLIGAIIGVIGILLFTKMPALIGNAFTGSATIVVMGDPGLTSRAVPLLKEDYDVKAVLPPQTATPQLLAQHDAAAAFLITQDAGGLNVAVYAKDPGSMGANAIRRDLLSLQLALVTKKNTAQVTSMTKFPVDVRTVGSKFTSASEAMMVRGVAYMLIFFLYILILVNSQLITSSVAEEKTSRIAELLVASVDPVALLSGKILAGAAIAVLQLIIWIAAGVLGGGSGHASPNAMPDANNIFSLSQVLDVITPGVLAAFLAFFIIGFFQVSTIFAALASLINRTEDLGSLTGPLTIPVIAAFFLAIATLGSPDTSWAQITSFIPIISPFVMFARIAVSYVPIWQIALSLAINLVALYLIAVLAGKIYRVGMLMYGRAPKLNQVWAVIRS